jgi:hypothetical protein
MAKTPVVASTGPIDFVGSSGQQVSLPLSALYFEDGTLKAAGPLYTANKAAADPWLQYLADEGLIMPAPALPPKQALLVTAKNAGSTGNDIRIAISNVRVDPTDATKQIFDALLTQTDSYDGLTKDNIANVLGSAASFTNGERPGLVFVSTAATDLPKDGTYAPATYIVDIPKNTGAGSAVKLTYRIQDNAATMEVDISNVNTDAGAFSLVAKWTKAKQGIRATAFQTNFSDHITVAEPDGSAAKDADVPAAGTIVLAGGSDAQNAQKASAAVPASD